MFYAFQHEFLSFTDEPRWNTMKHDETRRNRPKASNGWNKSHPLGLSLVFRTFAVDNKCSHYGEDCFSIPLRIVCHPVRLLCQRRAVGQDGAHQDGRQWPSKQALASCSTPLRKTKSPPENEETRRAGDSPLPAKDFGTASLPLALVHLARWYLMRLYDTNIGISYGSGDGDHQQIAEWGDKLQVTNLRQRIAKQKKLEYHMRLHENWKLFFGRKFHSWVSCQDTTFLWFSLPFEW